MPITSGVAWLVTLLDANGHKRWYGVEPGGSRRAPPKEVWDWVPCGRTVQFATQELAEQARLVQAAHWKLVLVESEEREFLVSVIAMVHSSTWDDENWDSEAV